MLITASKWPGRFPTESRVGYFCVLCYQSDDGTSRVPVRNLKFGTTTQDNSKHLIREKAADAASPLHP